MTQMYNGSTSLRRKPPVHKPVHSGKPIDLLPHEYRLTVSDIRPISWIVSNHTAVVIERSGAQSNGPSETRHDNRQSGASAIILTHPQPASVGNLAAEWRDAVFEMEMRIDEGTSFGKP